MLLTEFMLNSLSADKMSDILYDRYDINVYEYGKDDMSLSFDTADMHKLHMTPKEFNEFCNKYGWYVSGYGTHLVVIRKNNVENIQANNSYTHYYIKGSNVSPDLVKRIGLRAKSANALTDNNEDFKIGPIYSDKRNYIWDISTVNTKSQLAHLVEVAMEYGKYVYLIKLKDKVIKDPEYEKIAEPACFITRTIQPYEIIDVYTGTFDSIAGKIQKTI